MSRVAKARTRSTKARQERPLTALPERLPTNVEAARTLREVGLYLEMDGVAFKPWAYEKAAYAVEALDRPFTEILMTGGLEALHDLPGIGKSIAQKLEEMLRTGRIEELDADLRVVPAESFGAALLYFTGNKDHNVKLRRLAMERKWKLNEYGLFRGKHAIAQRTEEEIYAALDLAYVPPELREDYGEIEAALDDASSGVRGGRRSPRPSRPRLRRRDERYPRRAASMAATSIFFIVIMAVNARFASAPPAAIASVSVRGVICQLRPHRSLHHPQALSSPPLPTIAFQ